MGDDGCLVKVIAVLIGIVIAVMILLFLSSVVLVTADAAFGRLPFVDPEISWAIMGFILGSCIYLALVTSAQLRSDVLMFLGFSTLFVCILSSVVVGRDRAAVMYRIQRSETVVRAQSKIQQVSQSYAEMISKMETKRKAKQRYSQAQKKAKSLYDELSSKFTEKERELVLTPILQLMNQSRQAGEDAEGYLRGDSLYCDAESKLAEIDRDYKAAIALRRQYSDLEEASQKKIQDLEKFAGEEWSETQALLSKAKSSSTLFDAAPHYRAAQLMLAEAIHRMEVTQKAKERYSIARDDAKSNYGKLSAALGEHERAIVLDPVLKLMDRGELVEGNSDAYQKGEALFRKAESELAIINKEYLTAIALRRQYDDQADIYKDDIPELEKYVGEEWSKVKASVAAAQSSKTIFEAAPHYRVAQMQLVDAVCHMDEKRRKEMAKP